MQLSQVEPTRPRTFDDLDSIPRAILIGESDAFKFRRAPGGTRFGSGCLVLIGSFVCRVKPTTNRRSALSEWTDRESLDSFLQATEYRALK